MFLKAAGALPAGALAGLVAFNSFLKSPPSVTDTFPPSQGDAPVLVVFPGCRCPGVAAAPMTLLPYVKWCIGLCNCFGFVVSLLVLLVTANQTKPPHLAEI